MLRHDSWKLKLVAAGLGACGLATMLGGGAALAEDGHAAKSAKRYFVEFRARSALSYGHSFVVYGPVSGGRQIRAAQVVGLHPATESSIPWMIGHVLLVPAETGASDGDTEDIYVTAKYRVLLDKAQYDQAVASIQRVRASSPVWHAVLYNCNAFIGDIAKAMGLTAPPSTMIYPKEYVTALRQLNSSPRRAVTLASAHSADR